MIHLSSDPDSLDNTAADAADALDSQGAGDLHPDELAIYVEALGCTGWPEPERIAFLTCPKEGHGNCDAVWEFNKGVRAKLAAANLPDSVWLRRRGGRVR